MSTLKWIDMRASNGCTDDATSQIWRRHAFSYDSDPDTGAPRLISVDLFGREGTPDHHKAISLGAYTYGTASSLKYIALRAFG
jgi:hypothetical protein